jgi:hypothetical protein
MLPIGGVASTSKAASESPLVEGPAAKLSTVKSHADEKKASQRVVTC